MNKLHCVLLLVLLATLPVKSWAQTDEKHPAPPQALSATLWMDWTRGDRQYGEDFIHLNTACARTTSKACKCVADFNVISSKENSKEFADYVTAFPHGRVPVVYSLFYNHEGRFLGARLASVGNWPSDKFHPNDGLLGVQVAFNPRGSTDQVQTAGFSSPADCFPPSKP